MKYISDRVISFSLIIGNADKRIRFIPCMMGGSMYITDDEDEIKALEGSGMYGRVYRRDPNCTQGQDKPTGGKPQKAAKKAKEVPGVETWQEAIEYLTEKCGSTASLTTPDEILTEAAAQGIVFPNIN